MPATLQVTLPPEEQIAALAGGEHDDVLVELERTARFLADDHRTTAAWVRAVTNCSPADSRKRVRAAHALRNLPAPRDRIRDA